MRRVAWFVAAGLALGPAAVWAQSPEGPRYALFTGLEHEALTPEGEAICTALGVKPDPPCDSEAILEQSQHATDRALWFDKITSGVGKPPPDCLQPVAVATFTSDGIIWACHTAEEDDMITALDLQHLHDAATRLNADQHKTLASHQWLMTFKELWRRANR